MSRLKTIYIVDDDEDWLFLFKEAIDEIGYPVQVYEAGNGKEFFNILNQDIAHAVLLLDVNMPVMNGMETLELLRQNPVWAKLPTVLISTSSDKKLDQFAHRLGAIKFVTKPSDYKDYLLLIKDLCGYCN